MTALGLLSALPWHAWWAWATLALSLGVLEALLPGFVFLGFASGAAMVALAALLFPGLPPAWLAVGFAAGSLATWIALRAAFRSPRDRVRHWDSDIND